MRFYHFIHLLKGVDEMSDLEEYRKYVDIVLQECKGANENEVAIEFKKYEDDFLIPPDQSLRSIIRK